MVKRGLNMQKKAYILILVLILLVVSGCTGGSKATKDPTSTTFAATGSNGVEVAFTQNQPPAKVYTGAPLTVMAQVQNKGTYDVQNVDIFLSGFDPNIIRMGTGRKSVRNLDGKSTLNTQGDVDTVDFTSSNLVLPIGTVKYDPNVMMSWCYPYETIASPMACVDPRPQYTAENKACKVANLATGGSQGAPISVKTVEAQATPSYMVFRIHISNVGGGQVFDYGKLSSCPFNLQYSDLDKVYVKEVSLGTGKRPTECKPKNPLRLVNGQATLFCKFAQVGGPAFQTPLNVKLQYGYTKSVTKKIQIQNLNS